MPQNLQGRLLWKSYVRQWINEHLMQIFYFIMLSFFSYFFDLVYVYVTYVYLSCYFSALWRKANFSKFKQMEQRKKYKAKSCQADTSFSHIGEAAKKKTEIENSAKQNKVYLPKNIIAK